MDARILRLYQLEKQNLSVKAPAGAHRRLLKGHLGLHSTDYLTPYLSLWARIDGFEPRVLFNDLNRTRTAVRLRAFRGTVFVVHRDNLALILSGLRQYHLGIRTAIHKMGRKAGQDFETMERRVTGLLSGSKLLPASVLNRELRATTKGNVSPFFLRYLEFGGVLVRVGQSHAEDRTIPYGLLQDWFPEVDLKDSDPEAVRRELALAYIRKFGPVSLEDICWWMPAAKTEGRAIVQRLGDRLARFDLDGREYMMAREESNRLKRFAPRASRPIVNFLPYEDHFPKAYIKRDWFFPSDAEALLVGKGTTELGQIRPSIWLDGEIIGRWELERPAGGGAAKVKITGLVRPSRFSKSILSTLERERTRLERFVNQKLLPLCGAKEET